MTSAIDPVTHHYIYSLCSTIDILNACHFTYSPKEQRLQNFRKSSIISHRVNALQIIFLELLYYLLSSHKSLCSN